MRAALLILALTVLELTRAAPAAAATTYFAFEDERYLLPQQREGGAVFVAEGLVSSEPLPLLVFLHGTNKAGEPHLWLGGGSRDLRPVAAAVMASGQTQKFLLAAPSQTRHAAAPRALWQGLRLDAFIDAVVAATQGKVQVDRRRVIVAGHSGAGCNPTGGVAGVAGEMPTQRLVPLAVAAIDTCLDSEMGRAFSNRPASVPLFVYWQAQVWPRSPEKFWRALTRKKPLHRRDELLEIELSGPTAHDDIVPLAFTQLVKRVLPAPPPAERVAKSRNAS